MATLDLSNAVGSLDMTDAYLVSMNASGDTTPTEWSFSTVGGDALRLEGRNMSFDPGGHALTGTVTAIAIDRNNDNAADPDIVITGVSLAAKRIHDGPASFWRVLEGDDLIQGPSAAVAGSDAQFAIFGDAVTAITGKQSGGDDQILLGDTHAVVWGDVAAIGSSPSLTAATTTYRGGADQIDAIANDRDQFVSGDAGSVYGGAVLIGGDDSLLLRSMSGFAVGYGDAMQAQGTASLTTQIFGGDDAMANGDNGVSLLIGDVGFLASNVFVEGGDDTISGGRWADTLVGDVEEVGRNRLKGGDDRIAGQDGDDLIAGDAYENKGKVRGGDDLLEGGRGDDQIYGECFVGRAKKAVGGADSLSGDDGDDRLHGQSGDDHLEGGADDDVLDGGRGGDFLNGGLGDDTLLGGAGNDLYLVDAARDVVFENAGDGRDTIFASLGFLVIPDNVEDLVCFAESEVGIGGNGLGNVIITGIGHDFLNGLGGDDQLTGGAGDDTLLGGAGNDRFEYNAVEDGGDIIVDFGTAAGDNDSLWFNAGGFGGLKAGALKASRFVANADGVATTTDHRFVYDTDNGFLRHDADGSGEGAAEVIAVLVGTPTLSADDIFIL